MSEPNSNIAITPNGSANAEPGQGRAVSTTRLVLAGLIIAFALAMILRLPGTRSGGIYHPVYSFGTESGLELAGPSRVVAGADGALYGTSSSMNECVFRFDPHTGKLKLLQAFSSGGNTLVGLGPALLAVDGVLFGTTSDSVFRVGQDGSNFRVLHKFGPQPAEGTSPFANLVAGQDGALYGVTYAGGEFLSGVVYRINMDGTGYRVLHHFGKLQDGRNPQSGLTLGRDGTLYGTTIHGGAFDAGTVFRLDCGGEDYAVIHDFGRDDTDGTNPSGGLLLGPNSVIYGTTSAGGRFALGTIFSLNAETGEYAILHGFRGTDGAFPQSELLLDEDRNIYGTASGGGNMAGTVFRIRPDGSGFRVLHTFASAVADGEKPGAGLIRQGDRLYGTTKEGGLNSDGTIFCLKLAGR